MPDDAMASGSWFVRPGGVRNIMQERSGMTGWVLNPFVALMPWHEQGGLGGYWSLMILDEGKIGYETGESLGNVWIEN
jgi:hypothetical protein